MAYPADDIETRFWRYVSPEPTSGCWLWTGGCAYGYGVFGIPNGSYGVLREGNRMQSIRAHRMAWELWRGPVPENVQVLHKCDVKCCVNPDHLYLGSHADNMRDRDARGLTAKGEMLVRNVLTESDVREIRRRYCAGGLSQHVLANEFGVHQGTIHSVVRTKTWKHVE